MIFSPQSQCKQLAYYDTLRLKDGLWRKVAADRVLQGAGTQLIHTYLDRRQDTVADWVSSRPIFKVCVRETGYEVGGKLWGPWWRQAAAEKHLRVTLKEISSEARERQQRESIRCGEGEGAQDGGGHTPTSLPPPQLTSVLSPHRII